MKYLIYDIISTGHHSEYISHLVNYIINDKLNGEFYFIVSEEFEFKFPEIINKSKESPHIKWEFINKSILHKIFNSSLLKRSFKELEIVNEYALKHGIKDVLLLYFNTFQFALIFKKPKFNIKGILFLQFTRMTKNTFLNKIKYLRKYLITKMYLKNRKIKKIFILNDENSVDFLNIKFNSNTFNMLPDPIPHYKEIEGLDIYEYYKINNNKKILLHPGAIDPRKGTIEIIESIDFLSEKSVNNFAILIVGKANHNIEELINNKINNLKNKNFSIVFSNTFVSNSFLKSLFLQSFAVLMPYKNSEASSGILGHAILANKFVLTPDSGLIGEIVSNNDWGVLVKDVTANEIALGIEKLIDFKGDFNNSFEFIESHSEREFSFKLLN